MDAELLSNLELCERKGYWSRDYVPNKLHPTEIARRAIMGALADPERTDRGEHAGELVMEMCAEGIDTKSHQKYDVGLHHAVLSDILTTYLSRTGSAWRLPEPVEGINLLWEPKCLLRGDVLGRIVLVDHWNDDRAMAESRSWFTLGEMAAYKLPMSITVVILGASSNGKRHSEWSRGLLHPRNKALRFKKQAKVIEGFKDSWIPIWREDHNQITREQWLEAMEADGVIEDLTRTIHIDALPAERVKELRGVIERKTEKLYNLNALPDPNLTACDWPRPCPFRQVCFSPHKMDPRESGAFHLK